MMAESDEPQLEEGLLSGIRKALPRSRSPLAYSRVTVLLCGIAVLAYLTINIRSRLSSQPSSQRTVDSLYSSTWAQYAPYRPVAEYAGPPDGCIITQVNIPQRHGARFPTEGAEYRILQALGKLLSAAPYKNPRLKFLKDYKYGLGIDVMVPYGADESFESGREAYWRYRSLVNTSMLPFIRSDASQRVIDSTYNWTAGFSVASQHKIVPTVSSIMDAAARNNTLDGSQCPAAGRGEEQKSLWLATHYTGITAQLNADAPGAQLNNEDTYNLMSLCPFETLAYRRKSPWCKLFESIPRAFEGFEYTGDLDKFYKTGYGENLGPVQGVGYINELLARLTELPVQDHTQTNHSLDDFAATFPLNRTVYVDFSHDNQMIAIFSAMGLFHQDKPLNPIKADSSRTWRVSAMVPFAGRVVVERLSCSRGEGLADLHKMVRVLVQDQVQPLEFCDADEDRLCTLGAFIRSQAYARNDGEGDWEKCFE